MSNWIKVEDDPPAVLRALADGREMTNWIKVDNYAPAVMRALADGKKVRRGIWREEEWMRLGGDGRLLREDGSSYVTGDFSGTWFIEVPRDIVTDPQVGDEFLWDGDRAKVAAVDGGFVFYHDGEVSSACAMPEWASGFEDGWFTRIEDKQ